jgi:hypothetical protein
MSITCKHYIGLNEGIKAIEDAAETPKDLRSIADYIEKDASQTVPAGRI